MGVVPQIILTAVLSATLSGLVVWWLWRTVLLPHTEAEANRVADEVLERAEGELTAAGEALLPKFRKAIRDGIQDAILAPPTDRLSQTARGMTTAGVNVVEASLRRIFGAPSPQERVRDEPSE